MQNLKKLAKLFLGLFILMVMSNQLNAALYSTNGFYPYFNNPTNTKDIDKEVVKLINSAKVSVDLAVFNMDRQIILDALIAKHKAGIPVRIVTDNEQRSKSPYNIAIDQLVAAGIQVKTDNRTAFMHHKFIVVDNVEVLTGSYNFTNTQTVDDKNNFVVIHSSGVAQRYTNEFNEMWAGRFGTQKTDMSGMNTVAGATVYTKFSPKANIRQSMIYHLNTANVSVYFSVYSFTDVSIADKLIELHKKGVTVKGVFDAFNSKSSYSQYQRLRDAGVPVLKDDYAGLLHDKYVAIDCGTASTPKVITGSFNWSAAADESNDENIVIIYDGESIGRSYKGNAVYIYNYKAKE